MNQRPLATRRIGPAQSTFEERIDALCTEHGLTRTALGTAAGFSPNTVRNWVEKAARGALSRTEELHRFATHYKRTVDWLLGTAMLVEVPPEALRPDSKAMADEAVEMLVEIDGLDPGEAAALMVGIRLDPPSVKGYYKAARLKHAPRTRPDELEPTPPTRRSKKR